MSEQNENRSLGWLQEQGLLKTKRGEPKLLKNVRRRRWKYEHVNFTTLKDTLFDFVKLRGGKKEEKPPLYEKADGILVDKARGVVYLYLAAQLEYNYLNCYPYVRENTLDLWDTEEKSFDKCVEAYKDLESIDFRPLREEKEQAQKRVNETLENSARQLHPEVEELSLLQNKVKRKRKEKDIRNERQFMNEDDNEVMARSEGDAEISKDSLAHEQALDEILEQISQGESYMVIYGAYIKKKDYLGQKVMLKNKEMLKAHEEMCEALKKSEVKPRSKSQKAAVVEKVTKKQKKVDIERNRKEKMDELREIPIKFKDLTAFEEFKQSKVDYRQRLKYFGKGPCTASKLEKKGWNYYLVSDLAHEGLDFQEIKKIVLEDPDLKDDEDAPTFFKTIEKEIIRVNRWKSHA